MGTYDDPEFDAATEDQLKVWAALNHVEWTKTKVAHCPWRAFDKRGNGYKLCGVGRTLKDCLWMAYKLIGPLGEGCQNDIIADHEKYMTEVREPKIKQGR